MSYAFVCVTLLVQLPLMLGAPLVLGRLLARRARVPWRLWFAGALTFVASQVVHLPLNWAVGLLGTSRGLGLLPLVPLAIVAGLSAGLCEELARFVALRYVMKSPKRTWAEALQFGAGHGGIEAIILGVLVGLSFGAMTLFRFVPPASFGMDEAAAAQVALAQTSYWVTPWHLPLLGGLERLMAIACHIGMTVLVMRAVARRQPLYLVAAIGVHTALDAVAVYASRTLGVVATEGVIALFALAMVALTWVLREGPPATPPDDARVVAGEDA